MSGGSSSSIYTELKTVPYEYFYGQSQAKERWNDGILIDPNSTGSGYIDVLTRSIVDSAIYGGKRDKNACVITSNNKSYYSTIHLAGFRYSFPLRPLFFLSNNLKVKQSSKSGIDYEIDWTGTSEIVLSSIPVGSIVADIGEQADYEEYELPYSFGNGGAMVISKVNDVQRIHFLGGYGDLAGSVLNTHYMFNPQDKTFEQSTALPTALFSLQATPYYTKNGTIIRTYGGLLSFLYDSSFTNKVYYASHGGTWSEIGTIPYNAGGHSIVSGMGATYSGSVFLLGGDDKASAPTTRRKFYKLVVDTNIVQEYSPLPFDMVDGSAIWYNNTIYAITRNSDSLYYWKDNSTWEEYARLPHTNDGGKLMIVGEGGSALYYFGGSRSDLNYYKLNTQTKQFEIVGQLPYPFQYGAICCYSNGKIYLAGGSNNNMRNKMYKILKY
jgi:N-acetylneuraminic acid mutarotase